MKRLLLRIPPSALVLGALLVLAIARPQAAQALHPLTTDDASTLGARSWELELSSQAARPSSATAGYQLDQAFGVHLGLTSSLDVGITLIYCFALAPSVGWRDGLMDPVVDLKLRLLGGRGWRPALAVRFEYKPEIPSRLSAGTHDLGGRLLASWTLGTGALYANVGSHARALGSWATQWTMQSSLTAVLNLGTRFRVAAEWIYQCAPLDGAHTVGGLAALLWALKRGATLSAGLGPVWERGGRVGWLATVGLTLGFTS